MSTLRNSMRRIARRAIGVPDAMEVSNALQETREAALALQNRVEELATANSEAVEEIRRLRLVALEHNDSIDRLLGDRLLGNLSGAGRPGNT